MNGRNSTPVTIRIDDSDYERLRELAGDKTVNAFIKGKVMGYLEKINSTGSVHQKEESGTHAVHTIPLYNPATHKAGDKVMMKQGKRLIESIVPDMDADGYLMYED